MSAEHILTADGIVDRVVDAYTRRPLAATILRSLMASREGLALVGEYVECALASTAVRRGLRIEVSAEGWRVNGGPAWPSLDEAIAGRAAVRSATPPAATAPMAVAAPNEDDDEPQPF